MVLGLASWQTIVENHEISFHITDSNGFRTHCFRKEDGTMNPRANNNETTLSCTEIGGVAGVQSFRNGFKQKFFHDYDVS